MMLKGNYSGAFITNKPATSTRCPGPNLSMLQLSGSVAGSDEFKNKSVCVFFVAPFFPHYV